MTRLRKWLLSVLGIFAVAILGDWGIQGSNALSSPVLDAIKWLWHHVYSFPTTLMAIILILFLMVVWCIRLRIRDIRTIAVKDQQIAWYQVTTQFLQSFATQIDNYDADTNSDDDIRRIVRKLIEDIKKCMPGSLVRPYILRPDGDFLTAYDESALTTASDYARQFYIGGDTSRRSGVAGAAFRTGELQVAHLVNDGGKWVCDHPDYIDLHEHVGRPTYLSFICVPMQDEERAPFGVLCIDGYQPGIFDYKDVQELVAMFSWVIGRAIIVGEGLTAKRAQPYTATKPGFRKPSTERKRYGAPGA